MTWVWTPVGSARLDKKQDGHLHDTRVTDRRPRRQAAARPTSQRGEGRNPLVGRFP